MTPDLNRRFWELRAITLAVILFLASTIIVVNLVSQQRSMSALFLGVFAILFCLYTADTDRRLDRIRKKLYAEEFRLLEEQANNSVLNRRLKEVSALHKAVEAVSLERQPKKALDTVLRETVELFNAPRGSIMLLDPTGQRFVIASSVGLNPEQSSKMPPASDGVAGWVIRTREPILLTGKVQDDRFANLAPKDTHIHSAICAPLRVREKVIGVINCSSIQPDHSFTEYELKLLSIFARYASVTIENAQLFAELQKSRRAA